MKKINHLIITLSLVTLANKGFSQCTTVCGTVTTSGGSFTVVPSGTQTVYVANTPSVYVINSTGGTPADTIAAGVTAGSNNSTNAKESTLNYVNGGINNSLDTLANIDNNTRTIKITPSYSMVVGAGTSTISAGARFVSIANIGTTTATVNGVTLPAGITLSFPPVWNSVFNQIIYNAQASTLLIIQNR